MSAPIRMMTSITSVLMIILGVFYLFFNTSLDDQRSTTLRQIATVNLNKKAVRKLPTSTTASNQQTLAHYSLLTTGTPKTGWTTTGTVTEYEEAIWEQLYTQYGDKLSKKVTQKSSFPTSFGSYNATTRSRTWSLNGAAQGTIIFSYMYKVSLDNVYAVKVQTIISGRPYTINLAIVHDTSNTNFGNYSGSPIIGTAPGTMSSEDHKSGASIAKTYTTDTGYNVVWDTEFVQKLKYGMDHIRLTYTFNQNGQAVAIPTSLNEIYSNKATTDMPVTIMQTTAGSVPFKVTASQIKITNGTATNPESKIVVTLTKAQSEIFFNVDFQNTHKMLFRVYTYIANKQVSADYALGQAKLDTLDASGNVLQTQVADESKVRITPFAVQPIDTGMSAANAKITLTHFVNKLYGSDPTSSGNNSSLAQSQYDFAKAGNNIQ